MKAERSFEAFSTTVNEHDDRLGKTGNRCFHIGIGGGCGLRCAAFCDGECRNATRFKLEDVRDEFDAEELAEIMEHYPELAEQAKCGGE